MTTVNLSIAANGDDGEWTSTGFFSSTDAYLGDSSGNQMHSFFRFASASIPVGATISAAKIKLKSRSNASATTCNLKVHFEDADNPSAPSSSSDANGRSLSTGTNWDNVAGFTTDSWYDSPGIASDLQAIIDRAGWSSGNAINVYIKNNSSSTNAYRRVYVRDYASSYAAILEVTYSSEVEAGLSDGSGIGDSVDSFSLTDSLQDSTGISDFVDAYNFDDSISGSIGIIESCEAAREIDRSISDIAGIGDSADAGFEAEGAFADASGFNDSSDGFNWTRWLTDNRDLAVARYYCTITGAGNGTTDAVVPISSFQARKQTGATTYVSVVIPGVAQADVLAARADGEIVIEMAYLIEGVESIREEILRADLEQINIQEGPNSRSITLIGHQARTDVPKETRLIDPAYKARTDGRISYRFAVPDLYIAPGDTAQVGDDEFTVDAVVYMVSAGGGQTVMEVQE